MSNSIRSAALLYTERLALGDLYKEATRGNVTPTGQNGGFSFTVVSSIAYTTIL